MATMDVGIIINPAAGRRYSQSIHLRTQLANKVLSAEGIDGEVKLTDGRGSAHAIAAVSYTHLPLPTRDLV